MNHLKHQVKLSALSILLIFSTSALLATNQFKSKNCLLSFLPTDFPLVTMLQKRFYDINKSKLSIKSESTLTDILECLDSGATEISILSHSAHKQSLKSEFVMVYFVNGRYREVPEIFFKDFTKRVRMKFALGQLQLKRIRIIACNTKEIVEAYGLENLKAYDISIEYPPTSFVAKLFLGSHFFSENPVEFDTQWINESYQQEANSNSEGNLIYGYVHLKTLFFYRYGAKSILNGQYSISVDSLSFGLEEKWKLVWLKKSEVTQINVGETKIFYVPTFDFSVSFGFLGFEVRDSGNDHFESPLEHSDIDSFGVSLGLVTRLMVTRNF